jgi:superfamily II DNA or RNA helicase
MSTPLGPQTLPVHPAIPGDRILLRQRPWRVVKQRPLGPDRFLLELEALDDDQPRQSTILSPPDAVVPLPTEDLTLDPRAFDSFAAWSRGHRILASSLVRETGLLSGARFGRVALEAYQLAPALRILVKPRPCLLIADDVGLGKTIEAGLVMLELMARGRANRILIVAPPGLLLRPWQEELLEKFGLEFALIENAAGLARVQTELPAGINPWDALPRVLTSVDYLKKETVRNRALRKRWDLVIVDEAHALAESGTPDNPYSTQRTRLGLALRDASRGLLLLTATPHNGYPHSFRSLLELVEPTVATLRGSAESLARRVEAARIRRMKAQIKRRKADGSEEDVFPRRNVEGIAVRNLSIQEREILRRIGSYCSRTAKAAEGEEAGELITFAMQIIKKRALSSRRALRETLGDRLEALRKEEARETPPDRGELRDIQADLPLTDAVAQRVAKRILRSAIPREDRLRKNETKALRAIEKLLKAVGDRDPKIEALLDEIRRLGELPTPEKVIVFTEYLDTLEAIRERLEREADLAGRIVVLRGGLSGRQRRERQDAFERPATRVLLATDAASEGLNLQWSCRRVIHFELPWNPNRLEQRNGRVDRYGQTRPPEIRYLFYPDSPEDDVLGLLVGKIEEMARARVSTPDILGVIEGLASLRSGLVDLDPEGDQVEERKRSLVRLFEDRTAEFVRHVQPLVASGQGEEAAVDLKALLSTNEPLLAEDEDLEKVVLQSLGSAAVSPGPIEGTHRIEVPLVLRGEGVKAVYPAATFRRAVAVKHPAADVEFVTPLHPLVRGLAADARRRFLHVYPSAREPVPRRLAARTVAGDQPPSVLFTFLATIHGGGGLVEERLIAVRVDDALRVVGDGETSLRLLAEEGAPGEVPPDRVAALFGSRFSEMSARAASEAAALVAERTRQLRAQRLQQAETLRRDLEVDVADRLAEIQEDERRARGLVETTGQQRLFGSQEATRTGFDARRAAVEKQAEDRRKETAEFAEVRDPAAPRPLGALLLVPAGKA